MQQSSFPSPPQSRPQTRRCDSPARAEPTSRRTSPHSLLAMEGVAMLSRSRPRPSQESLRDLAAPSGRVSCLLCAPSRHPSDTCATAGSLPEPRWHVAERGADGGAATAATAATAAAPAVAQQIRQTQEQDHKRPGRGEVGDLPEPRRHVAGDGAPVIERSRAFNSVFAPIKSRRWTPAFVFQGRMPAQSGMPFFKSSRLQHVDKT